MRPNFCFVAVSLLLGRMITLTRNKQKQNSERKKRRLLFVMLILSLLILIPLLSVATYTWLAISKTPKVSDMEMTINSDPGLQLAWSADAPEEQWLQQLNFIDAVPEDTLLTPVTWSDAQKSFFTAEFGNDGRNASLGVRLSDEMDTNSNQGHYVKFTLFGRTGQNVGVSLSPAVTLADQTKSAGTYLIGTPVWQAEQTLHEDGGRGAQYATRIGFRFTKIFADGTQGEQSGMYIYEPNADGHVDGSVGYTATPSSDGAQSLVPAERLLTQTTSTWEESYPVERDVVIRQLGQFDRELELFSLTAQEKVKIEVYIWLEGMDVDCVNAIGTGAKIFANLQFSADAQGHSGLVPVV